MDEATWNALGAARSALPAWVPWLAPAMLASAAGALCLVTFGLKGYLARRALRQCNGAPWTERAREVFTSRQSILSDLFFALSLFALAWLAFPANYITRYGAVVPSVLAIAILLAGLAVYRSVINTARSRPLSLRESLRSSVAAFLLMRSLVVPLLAGMAAAGPAFDFRTYSTLALTVASFAFLQAGGSLFVLHKLGLLRPASIRHRDLIAALAAKMKVSVNEVYEVDWRMANAVALPLQRAVVFTVELLDRIDDDEIAAIAAHELSHLGESRAVVGTRVLAQYALAPLVFLQPAWATYGWWGVAASVAVPLAVVLPFAWLSRRLEHRADSHSHHEAGGAIYARALEKVYEFNLAPAVMRRQSSHPHLYDRLLAAGIQPAYERPKPPRRMLSKSASAVSWFAACSIFITLTMIAGQIRSQCWESERHMTAALATADGSVDYWLAALAGMRAKRGDRLGAAQLYRSAALDTGEPWRVSSYLASSAAVDDRCDEAARLRRQALEGQPSADDDMGTPYELYEAELQLEECWTRSNPGAQASETESAQNASLHTDL